jgi:hypothetical protein
MLLWTTTRLDPAPDYLSALSTQSYGIGVSAVNAATTYPVSLAQSSLSLAFVVSGTQPGTASWQIGTWQTDPSMSPPTAIATILLGPTNLVYPAGAYDVWLNVQYSATESYVALVDQITVY